MYNVLFTHTNTDIYIYIYIYDGLNSAYYWIIHLKLWWTIYCLHTYGYSVAYNLPKSSWSVVAPIHLHLFYFPQFRLSFPYDVLKYTHSFCRHFEYSLFHVISIICGGCTFLSELHIAGCYLSFLLFFPSFGCEGGLEYLSISFHFFSPYLWNFF